ncbi:thioredoxin-like protein [Apiospora arundinis]
MSDGKPIHVNSLTELNELFNNTTYVAIDFYADWCGPCKAIAPLLEELAQNHSLPGLMAVVKVNVDKAQDIARQYNISAMPTFLFFKEGRQVAVNGQRHLQGANPPVLKAAVEKLGALAKKAAAAETS